MRFSDFEEINDLLEAEYLVGYFGIRNVRISATNLFGAQLLGSGSAGFIPVFSDEKVLESSIIYIDGSNVSIGTTVDTGYKLFVDSGSLADGLYVTSQKTGLKIESTGLNENIVVFSGQEGDVFVIPTNTGASVVSLRKIVHPDATAASESATLGQVNSNIETTAQELQGEINLRVAYEDVGVPLGVAELDANGKIIISQIPDSILGQVSYQGVWNVSTNTPTLEIPPASTTKGDYYIVSGVGTFSGIDFQDGDWIISKGDRWEKVDNTDAVVSVFGRIGAIQAVEADYQAFYPKLSESYVNPTWISSLDWNKITNSPDFLLENQTITLSGDVTGSGKTAISTSISANAVTNEKIRQSAGLSVIGRSVSTSGNVSDITATQEGHVLRRSNGSLSFGLLTDVSISDLSWNKITGTPTTILGYGITDAYTKTETDNIVAGYVPYTGATASVNLGAFGIIANQFSVPGGSANQFLKANGSLDSTSYVPSTRSVSAGTGLTGGGNLSADRTISFDTVFGDNRYLAPLAGYVPYTGATTNVDLGNFRLVADSLKLKPTPNTVPVDQGSLYWDVDDNVIAVVLNGTVQKVGEDSFFAVENKTGSTILKGTNVRFAGTLGASGKLLIAPFIADGSTPSSFYMGVTSEDIPNNGAGKVYQFGRIRGIDTSMYSEGDILYASTTVAGGFQTTVPTAPNNIIQVAAVITSHANVGTIMVRPTIGSNINKDEGVKITSGSTGDILQLQSNGLFENVTKAEYLAGTSSQFVKGDGSLDSTEYVTIATSQTITGEKTFSNTSLILQSQGTSQPTYLRNSSTQQTNTVGRNSFGFNDSNNIYFNKGSLANAGILVFNNTAARAYTLPDASGTLALTSNLDAYVTLATTQTIIGAKTFSLDSSFNGVTVGRGAGSVSTNTAIGNSALLNNTTAVLNTAAGSSALRENTTGFQNTAFGSNSLYSNTTGAANTATGVNALFNNETGMQNTAVGNAVSLNNTTGSNNTVVGNSALLFNTTGSNNVALGFRAGQSIFSGDNTITNNSIYIGSDTRANGNSETNQIVIGHNAIGQGSNTVTIGNSSITLNRFFGTMRIGTINNGSGDFITTDANGVLTKRTAAQTLTDIGGVGGTGTAGQVSFWTGAGTQSGDSGFVWDNVSKIFTLSSPTFNTFINRAGGDQSNLFRFFATNDVNPRHELAFGNGGVADYTNSLRITVNFLERWRITSTGIFQSNGAQTIQTSTGALTLATGGGNGNILLSPNGSGDVIIQTTGNNTSILRLLPSGTSTTPPGIFIGNSATQATGSNVFGFGSGNFTLPSTDPFYIFSLVSGLTNENSKPIAFVVSNTSQGRFEALRITSTGNVGIGTSSPTSRLDMGNGTLTLPTLRGRTYTLTNVSSQNPNFVNGSGFNSIPVRVGDIIDLPFGQTRTVTAVTDTQLTVNTAWSVSFAGANVEGRGAIVFQTNNLDRVTITSAGNVGIGTDAPAFAVGSGLEIERDSTTATLRLQRTGTNTSNLEIRAGESVAEFVVTSGNTPLFFSTGGSERMRITSEGYFKASNTGVYRSSTGNWHELVQSNSQVLVFLEQKNENPFGPRIEFNTDINNTSNYFLRCTGNGTSRALIYSNGNLVNTNNSYGAISDIKLKENIEDANPKLDDLMKVKVRNYNLIGEETKQIGVIAQELEEVFPAMIDESEDFEEKEVIDENGNVTKERVNIGTSTKSVKYSVFVPMLIKAIQELKAELDILKQK